MSAEFAVLRGIEAGNVFYTTNDNRSIGEIVTLKNGTPAYEVVDLVDSPEEALKAIEREYNKRGTTSVIELAKYINEMWRTMGMCAPHFSRDNAMELALWVSKE